MKSNKKKKYICDTTTLTRSLSFSLSFTCTDTAKSLRKIKMLGKLLYRRRRTHSTVLYNRKKHNTAADSFKDVSRGKFGCLSVGSNTVEVQDRNENQWPSGLVTRAQRNTPIYTHVTRIHTHTSIVNSIWTTKVFTHLHILTYIVYVCMWKSVLGERVVWCVVVVSALTTISFTAIVEITILFLGS